MPPEPLPFRVTLEPDLVCECDSIKSRGYNRYYDMPDGCDIPQKIMVATRYGVVTGLILSTYDVLMYSHAVGLQRILTRYFTHTAPWALMGATFATVSNGIQVLRKKDDGLNYFLGGLACGPILGSYLGSKHAYLLGGLFLGCCAVIKKSGVDNGWVFFPDIVPHMNSCRSWRHDYSLAHDPKNEIGRICRDEDFE